MHIDRQSFHTGIPLVDRQHDAYLDLAESVVRQSETAQPDRQSLRAALDAALAYAVEHFDTEEYLMVARYYPLYDQHRAKHDVFREQASVFALQFDTDVESADYPIRLARWLVEWVGAQVQDDDRRLAAFLKQTAAA
jgi:hemerythrin